HMRLGREGGMRLRAQILGADPKQLIGLIDAAVEQDVVIGHVEVAVVVDPGGLNPHHGGDERRKEQRLKVGTVEHSIIPAVPIVPYSPRDGRLSCALRRWPSL